MKSTVLFATDKRPFSPMFLPVRGFVNAITRLLLRDAVHPLFSNRGALCVYVCTARFGSSRG